MNQVEIDHLKRVTDICASRGEAIELLGEKNIKLRAKIDEQAATIARLTAANGSMQEDAVQNTYAFNLMLTANKAQSEEIRTLKQALTDIRATTVTLGDSQSAWKAWRKCSDIAGEALK